MTDTPTDDELSLDPPFGPAPASGRDAPDGMPRSAGTDRQDRPPPGRWWASARFGLTAKLIFIGVLVIVLDGAISLVGNLVDERAGRQSRVTAEIGALWGRAQTISAPVLVVPVGEAGDRPGRAHARRTGVVHLLAETVDTAVSVAPQVRRRGLFETVVYTADVTMTGQLAPDALAAIRDARPEAGSAPIVFWEEARLVFGISDPRGIGSLGPVSLDGAVLGAEPATDRDVWPEAGVSVALGLQGAPAPGTTFSATFRLNGSERIAFVPNARNTTVALNTTWAHPGFDGAWLPADYATSDDGASAHWQVSHFGRGYPQTLGTEALDASMRERIAASAFGVRLMQPVTTYRRTDRAVKYGILFLVFTFAFVFFIEAATGTPVHLVQYATLGAPLTVFFALLLALAEHIGFSTAYVIGAGAVIAQVGWYLHQLLASRARTVLGVSLLAGQYGFLYTLLEMESYSLLAGAGGLWVLVGVLMVLTRHLGRSSGAPHSPMITAGENAR